MVHCETLPMCLNVERSKPNRTAVLGSSYPLSRNSSDVFAGMAPCDRCLFFFLVERNCRTLPQHTAPWMASSFLWVHPVYKNTCKPDLLKPVQVLTLQCSKIWGARNSGASLSSGLLLVSGSHWKNCFPADGSLMPHQQGVAGRFPVSPAEVQLEACRVESQWWAALSCATASAVVALIWSLSTALEDQLSPV